MVQIEEARQELLSRLAPEAQAFLIKRAAAKERTTAAKEGKATATSVSQAAAASLPAGSSQGIQTSTASTAGRAGRLEALPSTAGIAPDSNQAGLSGSAGETADLYSAGKAGTAGSSRPSMPASTAGKSGTTGTASTAGTAGRAQQQADLLQRLQVPSAERDTGANSISAAASTTGAIMAARLRFSLGGQVVGLRADSEDAKGLGTDQQILQRDILRC